MSIELDVLTYNIEIDFISENNINLNFVDGVTVYQNGVKVGSFQSIDFRDGTNTTVQVDNYGNKARVYVNSTASGGGGGSVAWGAITGTLSNQTDLQSTLDARLLKANNLSDLTNAATARTNLGATTVGGNLFTVSNPSAIRFIRVNADNSVTLLDASSFLSAIGGGSSTWGSITGTLTDQSDLSIELVGSRLFNFYNFY